MALHQWFQSSPEARIEYQNGQCYFCPEPSDLPGDATSITVGGQLELDLLLSAVAKTRYRPTSVEVRSKAVIVHGTDREGIKCTSILGTSPYTVVLRDALLARGPAVYQL